MNLTDYIKTMKRPFTTEELRLQMKDKLERNNLPTNILNDIDKIGPVTIGNKVNVCLHFKDGTKKSSYKKELQVLSHPTICRGNDGEYTVVFLLP